MSQKSGRLDPANAGGQGLVGVAQDSLRRSDFELSDTLEDVVIMLRTELTWEPAKRVADPESPCSPHSPLSLDLSQRWCVHEA